MGLNLKGGNENESKKIFFDLLVCLKENPFKHRVIDEEVDLFFPSNDLFIYLDKIESYFFISSIIEKRDINEIKLEFDNKFNLSNEEFYSLFENFCIDLKNLLL